MNCYEHGPWNQNPCVSVQGERFWNLVDINYCTNKRSSVSYIVFNGELAGFPWEAFMWSRLATAMKDYQIITC